MCRVCRFLCMKTLPLFGVGGAATLIIPCPHKAAVVGDIKMAVGVYVLCHRPGHIVRVANEPC